jgi:hypothetical protein
MRTADSKLKARILAAAKDAYQHYIVIGEIPKITGLPDLKRRKRRRYSRLLLALDYREALVLAKREWLRTPRRMRSSERGQILSRMFPGVRVDSATCTSPANTALAVVAARHGLSVGTVRREVSSVPRTRERLLEGEKGQLDLRVLKILRARWQASSPLDLLCNSDLCDRDTALLVDWSWERAISPTPALSTLYASDPPLM